MAQKTKIKKDNISLYVFAGGYITRPFNGTIFKEGDEVKTHHFGGSTNAGVTFNNSIFKFNTRWSTSNYELWTTTGILTHDYNNKNIPSEERFNNFKSFDDYLLYMTNWYQNCNKRNSREKINNDDFRKTHLK